MVHTDIFGNPIKLSKVMYSPYDTEANSKKKKRKSIDKNIRNLVWQKYNKNSLSGKCYVCKRPITSDYFEVGHNKAVSRGGKNNITNLRPICGPCNRGMGTTSIEQYKAKHFGGKTLRPKKKPKKKRKSKSNAFVGYGIPKIRIPKLGRQSLF